MSHPKSKSQIGVFQLGGRSVIQHLLVHAIRKNFLPQFSPPLTPGHADTHMHTDTCRRQTDTSQPNGFCSHTLLLFVLKQTAVLPLNSHIYSADVSLSSNQRVYLQNFAASLSLVYSIMKNHRTWMGYCPEGCFSS